MATPKLGLNSTRDYFVEILQPNYEEYKLSRGVRTTLNAAWPFWHIHEWHYLESINSTGQYKNRKEYGDHLTKTYKELLLIRDIAETAKHFTLHRSGVEVDDVRKRWRGMFNIGVHTNIPHSFLEVKTTASGTYRLDDLFKWAFSFWHGRVI